MAVKRENKEVVVVIGGNGILGQHIVRLLQEKRKNMEIRVVTQERYNKNLDYEATSEVVNYVGSVGQKEFLLLACRGSDCVLYTDDVCNVTQGGKTQEQNWKSYTEGTRNIIEACIEVGVPRLVFTSSTKVVIGWKNNALYSTEARVKLPSNNKFLFGDYAKAQNDAERLVLQANGQELKNGKGILHTLSLRPTHMYGELDTKFVPEVLCWASRCGGKLLRVGRHDAFMQATYAGNVAWAHILAMDKLRSSPGTVGGESYFITDDTAPANISDFAKPFLSARGFSVSTFIVPYYIMYIILVALSLIMKVISPFCNIKIKLPEVHILHYICTTYVFSRIKATLRLEYEPLYTWAESLLTSRQYYQDVKLK